MLITVQTVSNHFSVKLTKSNIKHLKLDFYKKKKNIYMNCACGFKAVKNLPDKVFVRFIWFDSIYFYHSKEQPIFRSLFFLEFIILEVVNYLFKPFG